MRLAWAWRGQRTPSRRKRAGAAEPSFQLPLRSCTCSSACENSLPQDPWLQSMPPLTCGALLVAIYMTFHLTTVAGDQCSGGSNIFAEIPENSPYGTLVSYVTMFGEPVSNFIQLSLSGIDAKWFYLDEKAVRLNVSEDQVLDREALETPVLMVSLTCMEDGFSPVEYRIIVQVMNENDNKPLFQEGTVLTQNISELAPVHSVVFSTQAEDGDGDALFYVIDSTSADARYFRIDLPNSGKIVLAKALDFETKRHLEFVVHAVEMNTKERYNSSARIHVSVMDGDDQYPQFLPCNFLSHDGVSICVSPIYTTNITEGEVKAGPLHFLPGAVHAEDGDRELKAAIAYSLLSETDHGYFHMDNITGAITMLRPVESRIHTPVYSFSIMASQVNDAKKYVVTEVRVRVLAVNSHPPHFGKPQYQAFVHEDESMAALVVTYSGRVLSLNAADMDFAGGFNPMVHYSLKRQSNHTQLFQITPSGLLIARANHLRALQRYALQITAQDEESGETTNTTVNVEVLRPGQTVPMDPLEAGHQGTLDAGILAGSLGALLLVTAIVLFLILRAMKKRQHHQQSMERAALAMEKHPNVVNPANAVLNPGNIYFQNEGYSDLGEETRNPCRGQALNSKPASVRSEKTVPAKEASVANAVDKAESQQGAQGPTRSTPKAPEEEEGARAALLNGKPLEQQPSCSTSCLEDQALPKDSGAEQPLDQTMEEKGPLPLGSQAGSEEKLLGEAPGGSTEKACLEARPQPEKSGWDDKVEASGGPGETEPAAESSLDANNCGDADRGGEHIDLQGISGSANLSQAIPSTGTATGTTEVSSPLPTPKKEPKTSLPMLKEVPRESSDEDDDGEETPKAMSPTYQDPLAALPVSDVRMPATLLQLLEDSIEC
ncbi:hypothetical protein lerEdw1_020860 [Lerista edwardsae]|nr:hypothetical protein lerEdw1_020860 [Lerista edwardsae]